MVYTAGDLRDSFFVLESSYGVIPTDALTWLGETIFFDELDSIATQVCAVYARQKLLASETFLFSS